MWHLHKAEPDIVMDNMKSTYNLDAASPRMMNKKNNQTICGEAEDKLIGLDTHKTQAHAQRDHTVPVVLNLLHTPVCFFTHSRHFQCDTLIRYEAKREIP